MIPTSSLEETNISSWLLIVYINSFLDLVKDIRAHLPILIFKRLSIDQLEKRTTPHCNITKFSMESIYIFNIN